MKDSLDTSFPVCRKCGHNERYANGACKHCAKEQSKAYYKANSKAIKDKKSALYKENPMPAIAASSAWAKRNPEKAKSISALWAKQNPEKIIEATAKWAAKNPHHKKIANHNRRDLIGDAGGKLSHGIVEKLLILQKGKCTCCGRQLGSKYHIDHIIPIALGGSNSDENIQLLREKCNREKHAKHPINFMQSRGFLC